MAEDLTEFKKYLKKLQRILSNSSIKSFFLLEEDNIKILAENVNLSEKEKIEIKSLKRGESLMFIGDNHILAKIECSEREKKIIE